MAFQLPQLPNLQTNIPGMPNALDQTAKLVSLKGMLNEQALRQQLAPLDVQEAQQRVQQQTTQNQLSQLELASQQAMMKAWSDPEFTKKLTGTDAANSTGLGFDPNAMTSELTSRGVLPKDALALTNQFVERSQKMATTAKDVAQMNEANAATSAKGYKLMADKIGSILDMPAAKAAESLAALKQDLVKNPKLFPGVPQEDLAHLYSADLEHLPAMASVIGLDAQIADFHKSKLEAKKTEQGIIPEGGGLSPEAQQGVAKDIAVQTNPDIQAGKVKVATAEGQARANIETAMARGSNAALAQVPPHLVAPASADATKAGTEYAQALSVSDRLAAMMDAAKKGNVVSYQLIPQEGALQITTSQGVHRINMAEIQNYGGGSIFQRLEGHIGKTLTGKSIPDSVLKDMEEMQKVQSQGAREKYENSLATINQTYGANFKPVEMNAAKPTAGPTKTLTLAQVQAAAKDHNISVDEATKQAKAAGYSVQ